MVKLFSIKKLLLILPLLLISINVCKAYEREDRIEAARDYLKVGGLPADLGTLFNNQNRTGGRNALPYQSLYFFLAGSSNPKYLDMSSDMMKAMPGNYFSYDELQEAFERNKNQAALDQLNRESLNRMNSGQQQQHMVFPL